MASRDHAVCLAAEHAERWGSPRSHKLADAYAEGAVLSKDRGTLAVLESTFATTPCSESCRLDGAFRPRRHFIKSSSTHAKSIDDPHVGCSCLLRWSLDRLRESTIDLDEVALLHECCGCCSVPTITEIRTIVES